MPSGVEYDGKTYSGSYGDFGAMASPLHPEGRSSDVDAKYSCTHRELMVKVIHSVSTVEYRDAYDEPIVFRQFQNVFGQFPFLAPSVLHFDVSKFELLGVRGLSMSESATQTLAYACGLPPTATVDGLETEAVGCLVLLERELPGPVPLFSVASLGQSVVIHHD